MKVSFLATVSIISAFLLMSYADESKLTSIAVKDIDGKDTSLTPYDGKVLLIVNVASECGYTGQYEGLEALWRKYREKGLVVVGFPSNDFGAQEPGSNAEIKQFCTSRYDVTFPMFEKIHVKGPEQHPIYRKLTDTQSPFPGDVKWNFGKFVVGRDGRILARFDSDTEPDSNALLSTIEKAL